MPRLPAVLMMLLLGLLFPYFAHAQPTSDPATCTNPAMTWYNSDGMNPCQQYQLLRQQCNPNYTIRMLNKTSIASSSPPDSCAANVACCCNTVAFNLAMLCANCQQGGYIDAGKGTYSLFQNECASPLNGQLPDNIQSGICSGGMDFKHYLYEVQTNDGSWTWDEMRRLAESDGDAPSGKCNAPASAQSSDLSTTHSASLDRQPTSSVTIPQAESTQPPPTQPLTKKTGISIGTVVGAVIGTAAFCALGFAALWWYYLRKPRSVRKRDPKGEGDFDILPSTKTGSASSLDLSRVFVHNPYIGTAPPRERPVTQTFSELTMPVPLTVPSDFNYQSSHSETPFSTQFPNAPGGWRNTGVLRPTSPVSRGSRSSPSVASAPVSGSAPRSEKLTLFSV